MKDPLANLPGYALRRASSAMIADLGARLEPLGLRFTESSVLMFVATNPGITQSVIGRALDIQRANMTPLVSRLEERGLITRVPIDGRSYGLTLSEAGAAVMKDVRKAVDAHEAALLARVPEDLRAAVLPVLRALWGEG